MNLDKGQDFHRVNEIHGHRFEIIDDHDNAEFIVRHYRMGNAMDLVHENRHPKLLDAANEYNEIFERISTEGMELVDDERWIKVYFCGYTHRIGVAYSNDTGCVTLRHYDGNELVEQEHYDLGQDSIRAADQMRDRIQEEVTGWMTFGG